MNVSAPILMKKSGSLPAFPQVKTPEQPVFAKSLRSELSTPDSLPRGLNPLQFHAITMAPVKFGASEEFNLDRFLDTEGDDWLCTAMDAAKQSAQGEYITLQDVVHSLVSDFQKDLESHKNSVQPLHRHADSYFGIKLGLSKNAHFEQDHQALTKLVQEWTLRLSEENNKSAVAAAERKKAPGPVLTEVLTDLGAIYHEMKQNAPPSVLKQAPLADVGLLYQVLLKLAPESLRQDLERFQGQAGLVFDPVVDDYLPAKLKEKYAVLSKTTAKSGGQTSAVANQPLSPAEREALLKSALPKTDAAQVPVLSARLRGATPKAVQWVIQQAKKAAEARPGKNKAMTAQDVAVAISKYTPMVGHELGCHLITPDQAAWTSFQTVTRRLTQAILSRIPEGAPESFQDGDPAEMGASAVTLPMPLTQEPGKGESKSKLFNRIVLAEAAKVIQLLVSNDTRVPNPEEARLASRTALMMSAQFMMLKNRIFVEGDPGKWMMAALPQQVHRDVDTVLTSAQKVAETLLNDYQPFIIAMVQTMVGDDNGLGGKDALTKGEFDQALQVFESENPGIASDCLYKIRDINNELFPPLLHVEGGSYPKPWSIRRGEQN